MPSEEEEMLVKTEEDEQASYWRVMDVDYGIAHCVSIDSERQETVFFELSSEIFTFWISSISAICILSSLEMMINWLQRRVQLQLTCTDSTLKWFTVRGMSSAMVSLFEII